MPMFAAATMNIVVIAVITNIFNIRAIVGDISTGSCYFD